MPPYKSTPQSITKSSQLGSDVEGTETWPYAGTAGAITAMGAKHVVTDVSQAHVDSSNKVCSSCCNGWSSFSEVSWTLEVVIN